ncbi:hypothetical protein [Sphingomonas nostoxanthinifaciens]|uniref:hypothetical protein n=1 Tax=Sphingomonas nostoxanthinifaciens TaxID=2872652 RepID=UPI001CC1D31E|nr:hypothetical protein [Sphingomonas nostoxanthinifaciens]UAK24548.1 hypothetical protein K8P63_19960 [Sphingomonas nostoxanthinifaciens]
MLRMAMMAGLAVLFGTAAAAARPEPPNPAGEKALAKLVGDRVAGAPVDCISTISASTMRVIEGTAITYQDGRTIYVNRPQGGASRLDDDDILVTEEWGAQLCSIDSVRLVDRYTRGLRGFVVLGPFVPYTKAAAR